MKMHAAEAAGVSFLSESNSLPVPTLLACLLQTHHVSHHLNLNEKIPFKALFLQHYASKFHSIELKILQSY
ncbi:hypothetical protein RJT34_18434 [Clitoria ternatea]|uniref:Uncharacterized protein n=1 Tax=Clitoria ternatea TaxID=43366 RepID=A0AAN9JAT4_CLITE